MATIQSKKSRGHKYWYIVESRRVNGKPRSIVLEYLGKPDDLLKRLQGLTECLQVFQQSESRISQLHAIANIPFTLQSCQLTSIVDQYGLLGYSY